MEIIETFGHYVENLTDKKPQSARRLLKTGWEAQNLKFRYMQDKRLMPADRHLANLMMDTMLWPLQKPEDSVIVSIFTPCEMMQEVGLHPYNVEGFSCYLSASKAERAFLQQAENQGIAETLCSYHKTFLGAAQKGLLPKPKCIVYTNLTCDANLLTFRTLADFYQVPVFAIDVPWNQTTENVQYVADQLKDLKIFLEKNTGKTISEDRLKERLACSKRTLENYKKYQQMRADRYVPSDLVTPLYAGMTNNILLGTAEEEKYTQMLLEDIKKAPAAKGKHIYWMHTIPFWSDAVRQELCFSEKAQIVGCELAETCEPDFDPENPFEAMAERMVYHSLNGSALRRIEAGIRHAKQAGADGAVWFGHWGCKHTLGAAQKSIAEAVSRYNEQRSDPDYYYLPDKLNGKKVKWESPADTSGMLLTGLFLIAAMAILVMKGREEQVQLQKRYEELLMDYPGLIMKFTLLVQAGMTVRKAFQKISLDYGRKRKRNPRPAYEEIRIVCYEMESGVSESEAYRRFGERCGQAKYKTFATLLIQNLQKGSRQMADMLERESTEAWEERKRKARVLGEAAATKLLVPMIMMLIVVMAIVMIPAFMSFYGET